MKHQCSKFQAAEVIEGHDVDRGRAEKSELQIVRHHELIVGRAPPAQSQPMCRLEILLFLLRSINHTDNYESTAQVTTQSITQRLRQQLSEPFSQTFW